MFGLTKTTRRSSAATSPARTRYEQGRWFARLLGWLIVAAVVCTGAAVAVQLTVWMIGGAQG
jgi:hypothetical protein